MKMNYYRGELETTNEGYALAKIAGLKLCHYYNVKFDTSYRCLMPTNLYGKMIIIILKLDMLFRL